MAVFLVAWSDNTMSVVTGRKFDAELADNLDREADPSDAKVAKLTGSFYLQMKVSEGKLSIEQQADFVKPLKWYQWSEKGFVSCSAPEVFVCDSDD